MKKKKGKQGLMTLKIDLKEAYDRIEQKVFEAVLHKVVFDT